MDHTNNVMQDVPRATPRQHAGASAEGHTQGTHRLQDDKEKTMTDDAVPAPVAGLPTTRPAVASRKARRPAGGARKVTRYTLDLEVQQHKFLRWFAIDNEIEASKVMRGLLYLLEAGNDLPAGVTLRDLVIDEIFAEDVPAEDVPTEETA
jgi:hypothetical protein